MNAWLAVLAAGLGSYALRVGVVVLIDRYEIPPWFERMSTFVMPAAFAGLTAGALAVPIASDAATALPVLAGAGATVAVARIRSVSWAVMAGMSALWLTRLTAELIPLG